MLHVFVVLIYVLPSVPSPPSAPPTKPYPGHISGGGCAVLT